MTRFICFLVLAGLAGGCGISVTTGSAPVSPAAAQVAYGPPPAYAPPSYAPAPTAHAPPTPVAVPPAAAPRAQPVAEPRVVPAEHRPSPTGSSRPATEPAATGKGKVHPTKPAEPKTKKKLRFKDTWVDQTHPSTAPKMERGPTPAGRPSRS